MYPSLVKPSLPLIQSRRCVLAGDVDYGGYGLLATLPAGPGAGPGGALDAYLGQCAELAGRLVGGRLDLEVGTGCQ
jgi:hypothetical protein